MRQCKQKEPSARDGVQPEASTRLPFQAGPGTKLASYVLVLNLDRRPGPAGKSHTRSSGPFPALALPLFPPTALPHPSPPNRVSPPAKQTSPASPRGDTSVIHAWQIPRLGIWTMRVQGDESLAQHQEPSR